MNDSASLFKGLTCRFVLSLLFATCAAAQVANTIPYKLNLGSTYQTGCFPPCACPLSAELALSGTLTVTCAFAQPSANGAQLDFAIRDVDWAVSPAGSSEPPVRLTGLGVYSLIPFGPGQLELMRLNLKIGDAPGTRLISGVEDSLFDPPFESRIVITLTANNMSCQDTVIVVDASPLGACCPAGPNDPACLAATEAECVSQGGAFQGMGSTCPTEPGALCGVAEGVNFVCPAEPWQPCCFSARRPSQPACFISTEDECATAGGTYLRGGDPFSCQPVLCDATSIACCSPGFPCTDGILDACGVGRIALGPGSSCATADCANAVTGACCPADPASNPGCFVATQEGCSFAGGTYRGDGTTCPIDAEELCGPFTGACCLPNAEPTESLCALMTSEACLTTGGIYQGDHTACDPALCNCCFPADSCTTMPPAVCAVEGGIVLGNGAIPAVSTWGVIVLTLLLVAAATAVIARRPVEQSSPFTS